MQQYFNDPSFPQNMKDIWNEQFGYIKRMGVGTILVTEWGGKYQQGSLDETWQNAFGEYLKSNDMDSFYWSLNSNSMDTGGLLKDDWKTPEQRKLDLLARVHPNPAKFAFKS